MKNDQPINIEKIGKAISFLRKRAGYTQKELADRIGISDKAVSKWERGQGLPEIAYLRKLSILLDTNSDSLLAGDVVHHDNGWQGILLLDQNNQGINLGTVIYDKPLVYYLICYFLLVGIKRICFVCDGENKNYVQKYLGDGNDYGIQLSCYDSIHEAELGDAQNLMVIHGRCLLYGVDQTRFFQRAMCEKDRLTILALPGKRGMHKAEFDIRDFDSNKPEKLRKQYDYSRIPIFFIPRRLFSEIPGTGNIFTFIEQHHAFVEMLDRGFVEFEIDDWNEVQDASAFIRIVQDKCGMNVYCPEEVAWRRGFISLDQLKTLGERKKNTDYGAYVLNLYEKMKSK